MKKRKEGVKEGRIEMREIRRDGVGREDERGGIWRGEG